MTLSADLNGLSPQFTLTCISTGGPATTVIWTRDTVTVTEGTETVLNDRVTAQYTHTLTVTGRLQLRECFTCIVVNNKPSSASASLFIEGIICMPNLYKNNYYVTESDVPTNSTTVLISTSVLRVSWNPPSDTDNVSGYILRYTLGEDGERKAITLNATELSINVSCDGENITVQTLSPNRLPSLETKVEVILCK